MEMRSLSRDNGVSLLFFTTVVLVMFITSLVAFAEESETYIVHVEEPEMGLLSSLDDRKKWYSSFVTKAAAQVGEQGEDSPDSRVLYAYEHVINGFAARLSKAEVEAMRKLPGFIEAYREPKLRLHTSYSSKFLGLSPIKGLWPKAKFGKGVIIGVLDGGVWPESASFSDRGIPPPPARWKGVCETAPDFNSSSCNNKLIGARLFNTGGQPSRRTGGGKFAADPDPNTPRDLDGHGTHVASTAAGYFVANADIFGNAKGTARGMAAGAHVASYKICGVREDTDCAGSDTLAGIEAAIVDGVDVLSLSLGELSTEPFYVDLLTVGAFRAIERGIFVSCAAGNMGPSSSTLSNDAPWIMTVGASTMDRNIIANAKLGNGEVFYGESLFSGGSQVGTGALFPLVHVVTPSGTLCFEGSLDPKLVAGKVVVCERGVTGRMAKGQVVREAGGAGMILINNEASGEEVIAEPHVLPATHVGFKAGVAIKAYINSTQGPSAAIDFQGTVFGARNAPAVAAFSSRGPSIVSPEILKPDVIAPGVAVLAAWPPNVSPSTLPRDLDNRTVAFNMISGTSMACPHVSGIAALLKSAHPDWSPAAIKSALLTTAYVIDRKGGPILDSATNSAADVFAMGAGHVDPEKAADPGLIYDLAPQDYILYLCGLNYTADQIFLIANKRVACPPPGDERTIAGNLNYPSFSVLFDRDRRLTSFTFKRTVTNVGPAESNYVVKIQAPKGVRVSVNPTSLCFTHVMDKARYNVTFTADDQSSQTSPLPAFSQGYLTWVSTSTTSSHDVYQVRSAISVTWL